MANVATLDVMLCSQRSCKRFVKSLSRNDVFQTPAVRRAGLFAMICIVGQIGMAVKLIGRVE